MSKIGKKLLSEWGSYFILAVLFFFIPMLGTRGSEGFYKRGILTACLILLCIILIIVFIKNLISSEKKKSVQLLRSGFFALLVLACTCYNLAGILSWGMDLIHGTENYEIYPSQITYMDTTSGILKDDKVNYEIKKDGSEAVIISVREQEELMSYVNSVDPDDLCEIQIWPRTGYVKKAYSASAERKLNNAAEALGDKRDSKEGGFPVFRMILSLILAGVWCLWRWSDRESKEEC